MNYARKVATAPVLQSLFPLYYRRRVGGAVDFILDEVELGVRRVLASARDPG